MPTTISTKAVEQSTFVITVSFKDEAGESVPPALAKWSLVDHKNEIVNGRENVEISSPSSEEDILLSGDDLKIEKGRGSVRRWLLVEATYSSDLGSSLPLKDQVEFEIVNLKGVE